MKMYNSFNEMFSGNTKQDISVFNTVSAIAEFDNGNFRRAYWDYGSSTVWFEFYNAETDELFEEDFGAHVDDDCFLNDVDCTGQLEDIGISIGGNIDDLWTADSSGYDNAQEYAYNNVDKVNNVVFKLLKINNLQARDVPSSFDEVGELQCFSDGSCDYVLDHTKLEPIDKELFESLHYKQLSELLAKFCNGVTDNSQGRFYTGGMGSVTTGSWGVGKFRPC